MQIRIVITSQFGDEPELTFALDILPTMSEEQIQIKGKRWCCIIFVKGMKYLQ